MRTRTKASKPKCLRRAHVWLGAWLCWIGTGLGTASAQTEPPPTASEANGGEQAPSVPAASDGGADTAALIERLNALEAEVARQRQEIDAQRAQLDAANGGGAEPPKSD